VTFPVAMNTTSYDPVRGFERDIRLPLLTSSAIDYYTQYSVMSLCFGIVEILTFILK
jgi:hypothetical protein